MSRFTLSPSAEADMLEIQSYTLEQFGLEQAASLDAAFQAAFQSLAEMPATGHLRPELDPPGRKFRYRTVFSRFVIVYQLGERRVQIVRVLNGSRDLRAILHEQPDRD